MTHITPLYRKMLASIATTIAKIARIVEIGIKADIAVRDPEAVVIDSESSAGSETSGKSRSGDEIPYTTTHKTKRMNDPIIAVFLSIFENPRSRTSPRGPRRSQF